MSQKAGQGLFLRWLFACVLGASGGYAIATGAGIVAGLVWLGNPVAALGPPLGFQIGAVWLGTLQAVVLRGGTAAPLWILALVVGVDLPAVATVALVVLALGGTMEPGALTSSMFGLVLAGALAATLAVGVLQSLLLARIAPHSWSWVAATFTGVVVGLALGQVLSLLLFAAVRPAFMGALGALLSAAIFGAVFGAAYGSVTGRALLQLVRQPGASWRP